MTQHGIDRTFASIIDDESRQVMGKAWDFRKVMELKVGKKGVMSCVLQHRNP